MAQQAVPVIFSEALNVRENAVTARPRCSVTMLGKAD